MFLIQFKNYFEKNWQHYGNIPSANLKISNDNGIYGTFVFIFNGKHVNLVKKIGL